MTRTRARRGKAQQYLLDHVGYTGDDCIMWPHGKKPNGYGTVYWDGKTRCASRLMCELTYGEPSDPSLEAAHSCGNRLCINPKHLSWKTPKENQADRLLHGTDARGENNANAKLPDDVIPLIREELARGTKQRVLAERYGVHQTLISQINTGKIWNYAA